jgi:hypothetical protein
MNVLKVLYYHYEEDFKTIASEMNRMFAPKHYTASRCKKVLITKTVYDVVDRTGPSHSEMVYVFGFVREEIFKRKKNICIALFWHPLGQSLQANFPRKPVELVRHHYFNAK